VKSLSVDWGVILFIIGLAIFGYEVVWGADWRCYGTNEEGSYFYETESMIRSSENVRMWVKSVYTEEGLFHLVKWGGKEFQNLDFSLILCDVNCPERSIRYLRIVFYSKSGEVFYPMDNDEWHFFAPDSMPGILLKEICN